MVYILEVLRFKLVTSTTDGIAYFRQLMLIPLNLNFPTLVAADSEARAYVHTVELCS